MAIRKLPSSFIFNNRKKMVVKSYHQQIIARSAIHTFCKQNVPKCMQNVDTGGFCTTKCSNCAIGILLRKKVVFFLKKKQRTTGSHPFNLIK